MCIRDSLTEIISEDIPGWLVSNEGNLTVALEVELTPELKKEMCIRDSVKADKAPYIHAWITGGKNLTGEWPGKVMDGPVEIDGAKYWTCLLYTSTQVLLSPLMLLLLRVSSVFS